MEKNIDKGNKGEKVNDGLRERTKKFTKRIVFGETVDENGDRHDRSLISPGDHRKIQADMDRTTKLLDITVKAKTTIDQFTEIKDKMMQDEVIIWIMQFIQNYLGRHI